MPRSPLFLLFGLTLACQAPLGSPPAPSLRLNWTGPSLQERSLLPDFGALTLTTVRLTYQRGTETALIKDFNFSDGAADLELTGGPWTFEAALFATGSDVLDPTLPIAWASAGPWNPGDPNPQLVLKPLATGTSALALTVAYPVMADLSAWKLQLSPPGDLNPAAAVLYPGTNDTAAKTLTFNVSSLSAGSQVMRFFVLDAWKVQSRSNTELISFSEALAAFESEFPLGWEAPTTALVRFTGNMTTRRTVNFQNDAQLYGVEFQQGAEYLYPSDNFRPSRQNYTLFLNSPDLPLKLYAYAPQASALEARLDGGAWAAVPEGENPLELSLGDPLASTLEVRVTSYDGSVTRIYTFALEPNWNPVTWTINQAGSTFTRVSPGYARFNLGELTESLNLALTPAYTTGAVGISIDGGITFTPVASGTAGPVQPLLAPLGSPTIASWTVRYYPLPANPDYYITETIEASDLTPPPELLDLTYTAGPGQITLAWTLPTGPFTADLAAVSVYVEPLWQVYPLPLSSPGSLSDLAPGTYTLTVRTQDLSGNASEGLVLANIVVEAAPSPYEVGLSISLENPSDATVEFAGSELTLSLSGSNGPPTMTVMATASFAAYTWILNGSTTHMALSPGPEPYEVFIDSIHLSPGAHTLTLFVEDAGGESYSHQIWFTVVE